MITFSEAKFKRKLEVATILKATVLDYMIEEDGLDVSAYDRNRVCEAVCRIINNAVIDEVAVWEDMEVADKKYTFGVDEWGTLFVKEGREPGQGGGLYTGFKAFGEPAVAPPPVPVA